MLEGLFEELNSFSEVSISFGPSRTLDLKLFPFYGNPARVEDWEVPVALVPLMKMRDEVTWDLTMYKVSFDTLHPFALLSLATNSSHLSSFFTHLRFLARPIYRWDGNSAKDCQTSWRGCIPRSRVYATPSVSQPSRPLFFISNHNTPYTPRRAHVTP